MGDLSATAVAFGPEGPPPTIDPRRSMSFQTSTFGSRLSAMAIQAPSPTNYAGIGLQTAPDPVTPDRTAAPPPVRFARERQAASGGPSAGVIVAGVIGVGVLGAVGWLFLRKKKR
jgi:LPXTG-motif cell wall-anchored protein